MTQASALTWSERAQARLMAIIDAAWASIEASDDPVLIRKAREKARVCGELAGAVRKVMAITGSKKAAPAGGSLRDLVEAAAEGPPGRSLERLKSGRGRL